MTLSLPLSDVVAWVVWVMVNGLLAVSSYAVGRKLDPDASPICAIVDALIIGWATVVASATVLGLFNALAGLSLLGTVSLLAAAGLLWVRQGAATARERQQAEPETGAWICAVVWLILSAIGAARILTTGLLAFPTDFDTLMYHLPLIDQWLHAGSLYAPACAQWSFPGNNELLGLWSVAPFSGDFFIALNNIIPTALLVCATVGLGDALRLSKPVTHLASIAVVSNLVVLNELVDAKNDIAVAALFTASLLFGVRYARDKRAGTLILGATSLGLLAGVKFFALGYAAVAWTAIVVLVTAARGGQQGVRFGVAWACGIFVFSGYWYLRNAAITGSFFYPLELSQGGGTLTRIYPQVWQSSFIGCGRAESIGLGINAVWKMTGPVNITALVVLPLSLAWVGFQAIGRFRQGDKLEGLILASLIALTIGAFFVLIATPYSVEDTPGTLNQLRSAFTPVRYGLSFLTLTILMSTVALEELWRGRRTIRHLLLGLLVTGILAQFIGLVLDETSFFDFTSQQSPSSSLAAVSLPSVLLCVVVVASCLALAWSTCSSRPRVRLPVTTAMIVLAIIISAGGARMLSGAWHSRFAHHYDHQFYTKTFSRIEHSVPDGSSIFVLDYRPYPFFGSRRQFKVDNPAGPVTYQSALLRVESRGAVLAAIRKEIDPPWSHYRGTEQFFFDRPGDFRPFDLGVFLSVFEVVRSSNARPYAGIDDSRE